ncbi:MAG TPA: hypothetical protein VEI02_15215 [Planctomycetota bacterium]|nr:hypothetical protein [Planctomycetota bacterium]
MPTVFSPRKKVVYALAGARGAAIVDVSRESGALRARILARRRAPDGDVAAALGAAFEAADVRGARTVVAAGELISRCRLIAAPPAEGAVLRALLRREVDAGDVFLSTPAGPAIEDGRLLAGHFVVAAPVAELTRFAEAIETRRARVEAVCAYDRALMVFAGRRAGAGAKLFASLEPGWINLVYVAGGRPSFLRRIETPPDLPAAERLAALVGEAQKTLLVVRGRLKAPTPEGVVVCDPLGVLAGVDPGSEEVQGLPLEPSPFPLVVEGADDDVARSEAVRAAILDAVRRDDALRGCAFDVPTRFGRARARRRRVAAAALAAACFAAGFSLRRRLADEASELVDRIEAARAATLADADAPESVRDVAERFGRAHGEALRFEARRGRAAALLAALAAAAPPEASFDAVEAELRRDDDDRPFREVRLEGVVHRDLAGSRDPLRRFSEALRAIDGARDAVELPATNAEGAAAAPTPFRFRLRVGVDR